VEDDVVDSPKDGNRKGVLVPYIWNERQYNVPNNHSLYVLTLAWITNPLLF